MLRSSNNQAYNHQYLRSPPNLHTCLTPWLSVASSTNGVRVAVWAGFWAALMLQSEFHPTVRTWPAYSQQPRDTAWLDLAASPIALYNTIMINLISSYSTDKYNFFKQCHFIIFYQTDNNKSKSTHINLGLIKPKEIRVTYMFWNDSTDTR